MRNMNANHKILLVPIREMTGVLTVQSKAIDLSRDTWVRMKRGMYKGDLAQVRSIFHVLYVIKLLCFSLKCKFFTGG